MRHRLAREQHPQAQAFDFPFLAVDYGVILDDLLSVLFIQRLEHFAGVLERVFDHAAHLDHLPIQYFNLCIEKILSHYPNLPVM